jgi:hypothetical protein
MKRPITLKRSITTRPKITTKTGIKVHRPAGNTAPATRPSNIAR